MVENMIHFVVAFNSYAITVGRYAHVCPKLRSSVGK